MFSGIVKHTGKIISVINHNDGKSIVVKNSLLSSKSQIGNSIAVDGVCLTITRIEADNLFFDVWQESLLRTTLGSLQIGQSVHLELALLYRQNVSGHLISGHVDYVAEVLKLTTVKDSQQIKIWLSCPQQYDVLLPLRGCVALAGVSLTITDREIAKFSVSFIPETLRQTLLENLIIGSAVNIETDFSARNQQQDNALLSWVLPQNFYPQVKAKDNYQSLKLFYKSALPVIIRDNERYYFVASIVKIVPQVLQFILGIARSRCAVACNTFIADQLAIPSASINSTKQLRRQLVPISFKGNDLFDYRAENLIKTMGLFLRGQTIISNWQTPGYVFAVETSKEDYNHKATVYEAAVHLALLLDKQDANICCEIHNNMGKFPSKEDISSFALRYNLPICSIEEVLSQSIPDENY